MKERPILFSAPMVQALLAGTKTQTRRIVKPQPPMDTEHVLLHERDCDHVGYFDQQLDCIQSVKCPFGKPGDRLWVRESWSPDFKRHYPCDPVWYAADDNRKNDIETRDGVRGIYSPESKVFVPFLWYPSIHMRRDYCRIILEITDLRVEKVQGISLGDICKEGLATSLYDFKPATSGFAAWQQLWDATYGKGSFEANPWVWVVEFKRVEVAA